MIILLCKRNIEKDHFDELVESHNLLNDGVVKSFDSGERT
jgi:uncharacterized protein YdcH (DUF465 family)